MLQGKGIFLTARGQDINRQPNILYITTDHGRTWTSLHEFVNVRFKFILIPFSQFDIKAKMGIIFEMGVILYFQCECECYDKDKHDFLIHQLNLYKALCYVCIQLWSFLATDNKNICRTLGIKDILRVVVFLREGTITPLT